ncbi:hypothetical protein C7B81_02170 [Aphanothece cf. minutissima CCALA 015]|uniref:Uncharacterized protein n=1 Tax=Aphanothece cf. minutissima CCALA 015 TaxID=2107695 RepID=A0ABX5FCF8_9CHRO|nr:hypothetical protein C7B81_02170 [Aphanothece cf. minutissima CCALA 015]
MVDATALSLCLQVLFWLTLGLSSLPLIHSLRLHWLGISLAAEFARECRRRRRTVLASAQR